MTTRHVTLGPRHADRLLLVLTYMNDYIAHKREKRFTVHVSVHVHGSLLKDEQLKSPAQFDHNPAYNAIATQLASLIKDCRTIVSKLNT